MNAHPQTTILRWSRFAPDPYGSGGEKRTVQLTELLEDCGIATNVMRPPAALPRLRTWWAGFRSRLRHGSNASVDGAGIGLLGYRTLFYRRALAEHTGARVLWWETTYDDILPDLARAAGYRVIAVPHNLESLVSDRVFRGVTHDRSAALGAEVQRLARADAVFTISREERWFLESQGIKADYLPFYVPRAIAADCARVRAARATRANTSPTTRGPVVLLGSAFNPATERGMRRQLEHLAASSAFSSTEIVIAGRDTERFFGSLRGDRIRVAGTLDQPRLEELMVEAAALLVHTEGGAGALTRIPEALAAGVPIIANANAARDQYGTPGVYVYETGEELNALVRARLPMPPAPPKPEAAEQRLVAVVRELAAR